MPREFVWFTLRSAASWTGVSIGFGRSIMVLKVFCREVTKSSHFQGLATLLSSGTSRQAPTELCCRRVPGTCLRVTSALVFLKRGRQIEPSHGA